MEKIVAHYLQQLEIGELQSFLAPCGDSLGSRWGQLLKWVNMGRDRKRRPLSSTQMVGRSPGLNELRFDSRLAVKPFGAEMHRNMGRK